MLYIFDKDNTIVFSSSGRPPSRPEEQIVPEHIRNKIAQLRAGGHKIAIASNQGGVAWGFISEDDARALILDAAGKIGGVDAWRFSPYDPKAARKFPDGQFSCDHISRKPNPGMLIEIMAELGFSPADTIMVGDSDDDRLAAQRAGCQFVPASDFFRWKE